MNTFIEIFALGIGFLGMISLIFVIADFLLEGRLSDVVLKLVERKSGVK